MKNLQDKYFEQAKKANNPQPFFDENQLRSLMDKGSGYIDQPKSNMLDQLTRNARDFAASTGGKITMTLFASAFTIAIITLLSISDNVVTEENQTSNNQITKNEIKGDNQQNNSATSAASATENFAYQDNDEDGESGEENDKEGNGVDGKEKTKTIKELTGQAAMDVYDSLIQNGEITEISYVFSRKLDSAASDDSLVVRSIKYNIKNKTITTTKEDKSGTEVKSSVPLYSKLKEITDKVKERKTGLEYSLMRLQSLAGENRMEEFKICYRRTIQKAIDLKDSVAISQIRMYSIISQQIAREFKGTELLQLTPAELEKLNIRTSDGRRLSELQKTDLRYNDVGIVFDYEDLRYNDVGIVFDYEELISDYGPKTKQKLEEKGYNLNSKPVLTHSTKTVLLNRYTWDHVDSDLTDYDGWRYNEYNPIAPVMMKAHFFVGDIIQAGDYYTFVDSPLSYKEVSSVDPSTKEENPYEINTRENAQIVNRTNVDKLIPILVKMGEQFPDYETPTELYFSFKMNKETNKYDLAERDFDYNYAEIVLWFYPTEEFLSKLPERYRKRLRNELSIIAKIENGEMKADEACSALNNENSLFDLCRLSSNGIKDFIVYPNPNSGNEINLKFELIEKCSVEIRLHKMSGQYVETLKTLSLPAGTQEIKAGFKNKLNPGVYLLSLSTDKGENVVQRLIVQ